MPGGRKLTFTRQTVAILGPAVVLAVVGVVTWVNLRETAEKESWVAHTREVIFTAADLRERVLDAETAQRGYLLTDSSSYLQPFGGARAAASQDLTVLHRLTIDNHHQGPRLNHLDRLVTAKFDELDSTVATRQRGNLAAAVAIVRAGTGRAFMDTIRSVTTMLTAEEQTLLDARIRGAARARSATELALVLGGALTLMIAVLVNGLLTRYAAEQEAAREQLATQNATLQDQTAELELQAQHLQEQAIELEHQADTAQELATEVEVANEDLSASNDELIAANTALSRARTEADAANRAKADFLAAMSHDLRTPLNAINGYAELLETGVRGEMTVAQVEDVRRIRRAGMHLLGLITTVLNYVKVDATEVKVHPTSLVVDRLLADAAAMVEPQARAKSITFICVPCAPTIRVTGDTDKVIEIILNLLTNAVKFTESGGRVSICADDDLVSPYVSIVIQDTGRGIPVDDQHRVFEPFVQLGRKLHGVDGGAGLGLAISRRLARAMNGDLLVTSATGAGSTFTLRIPRSTR